MNAREFEVGGQLYSAGRLDAFTQLHVGRRLAPLMAYVSAQGGKFNAITEALSLAQQADVDFVVRAALRVVKRRSGDSWANVYNAAGDKMAFEDIDGVQMLEIVGHALQGDILPFFAGLVRLGLDTDLSTLLTSESSPTPKTSS